MADSAQSQTEGREIPTRRVVLNDVNQMPHDYSTTPGGTMFSTTPGGTRIVYDRTFLLKCRSSPLARTPPTNLPNIPGVTTASEAKPDENGDVPEKQKEGAPVDAEHPQFEMDI